jgi:hypothetical protein
MVCCYLRLGLVWCLPSWVAAACEERFVRWSRQTEAHDLHAAASAIDRAGQADHVPSPPILIRWLLCFGEWLLADDKAAAGGDHDHPAPPAPTCGPMLFAAGSARSAFWAAVAGAVLDGSTLGRVCGTVFGGTLATMMYTQLDDDEEHALAKQPAGAWAARTECGMLSPRGVAVVGATQLLGAGLAMYLESCWRVPRLVATGSGSGGGPDWVLLAMLPNAISTVAHAYL